MRGGGRESGIGNREWGVGSGNWELGTLGAKPTPRERLGIHLDVQIDFSADSRLPTPVLNTPYGHQSKNR